MSDTLDVIRQQAEITLDLMKKQREPLNAHPAMVPVPSNYEIAQTYLLLKILDKLESIDDTLTAMGNDSWNDHHEK